MSISRTMTLYVLTVGDEVLQRSESRSALEKIAGRLNGKIEAYQNVRTKISDDDYLNAPSFDFVRDKEGNPIVHTPKAGETEEGEE